MCEQCPGIRIIAKCVSQLQQPIIQPVLRFTHQKKTETIKPEAFASKRKVRRRTYPLRLGIRNSQLFKMEVPEGAAETSNSIESHGPSVSPRGVLAPRP